MTKPVVLLVHGMGIHNKGEITKEFARGVNEGAEFLGKNNFKIESEVEFREFNYSERLVEIKKEAAAYQAGIAPYLEYVSGFPLGDIVKILSKAEAKFGDDSFIYTHFLDVLYYGLTYHSEEIRIDFANDFLKLISECKKNGTKLHIVGHSLGTAVVHDSLAKLYRQQVPATDKSHLSTTTHRFESLWSVSNVSRLVAILTRVYDPEKSIVHDSNPALAGCAENFYNIHNKFDPFQFVKRYQRPIVHGADIGFEAVRKLNNGDLKVNPHDIAEYMACPTVAWEFLYATLDETFTSDTLKNAMDKYFATTIQGKAVMAYEKTKEFMQSLGDIEANDFSTFIKSFMAAKMAFDEFKAI